MPTLSKPTSEVHAMLARVMEDYHPELIAAGVTVGLLAQWPSEGADPDEPCLKHNGYPAAAVIKITPYRQRVQGIADAVITLDGRAWEGYSEPELVALLDHELHHLELARDEDGQIKADDAGRPKLKMRLHDITIGGFSAIIARHGKASLESQAFHEIHERCYQQLFKWSDDMGGGDRDEPGGDEPNGEFAGRVRSIVDRHVGKPS